MSQDRRLERLNALIDDFRYAMLVTHSVDDELRARPMFVVSREDDGSLWFVTSIDSAKVDEISEDDRVSVTFQGGSEFVSLSGLARLEHDPERVQRLYRPDWATWFPEGADDPKLRLLQIQVQHGEYWDLDALSSFQFAWEAGKALIRGEAVEPDTVMAHGKVANG